MSTILALVAPLMLPFAEPAPEPQPQLLLLMQAPPMPLPHETAWRETEQGALYLPSGIACPAALAGMELTGRSGGASQALSCDYSTADGGGWAILNVATLRFSGDGRDFCEGAEDAGLDCYRADPGTKRERITLQGESSHGKAAALTFGGPGTPEETRMAKALRAVLDAAVAPASQ